MQMAVIIDVALLVVLLIFTLVGWQRGAVKSIIGIVMLAAALLGASFISQTGAPVAAKALTPVFSDQVEARLAEFGRIPMNEADTQHLFSAAGLYEGTARNMAQDAMEQVHETGRAILEVALERMITSVASAVLFVISFVLLIIALKIAARCLGLLTAVPGIHFANAALGGTIGFLQGCLILFAAVWVIQFFGSGIDGELVSDSIVLHFFSGLNPVAFLTGL